MPAYLSNDFDTITLPQQYIRTFNVSIRASQISPPTPAKGGLPGWAIALIVIGSLLVVGGLGFLGFKKYQAGRINRYAEIGNQDGVTSPGNVMHW